MNKKLKIFLISFFSFLFITVVGLFILYNTPMIYKHPGLDSNITVNIENALLEVKIVEIEDNSLLVKPIRDYEKFVTDSRKKRKGYEFLQTDTLAINLENTEVKCNLEVGKIVYVNYRFVDGKKGKNPIYLNTVEYISDKQE